MKPFLNSNEVAELLQCVPGTVDELLQRGELPGVKFGRSWVIPSDALLQFINQSALEQAASRRAALKKGVAKVRKKPLRTDSPS